MSAKDRDVEEAQVFFPDPSDLGINLSQVPVVIVYNGFHHYVGTSPSVPTFKDKVFEMSQLLQQARIIGDNLQDNVENPAVKNVLQQVSGVLTASAYNIEKLFTPKSETEVLEATVSQVISQGEPQAKKRKVATAVSMSKEGTSTMTNLHCNCGIKFNSKQDVKDHVAESHQSSWNCSVCPKTFSCGKTVRKHYRTIHLREFLYWCKYCNYGSDKKYHVENHMLNTHGHGQSQPCPLCHKMFPSTNSRDEHQKFCGKLKILSCSYCGKKYKRLRNLKKHTNVIHLKISGQLYCEFCKRAYQSLTSYKAHYTQFMCYKNFPHPQDEEEEDDEEDEDEPEVQQQTGATAAHEVLPLDYTEQGVEGDEEDFQMDPESPTDA